MNSSNNTHQLFDSDKTFWSKHPYLKWIGIVLLPGLPPMGAALANILTYLKVDITVNLITLLISTEVAIVVYVGAVSIAYIKDIKTQLVHTEIKLKNEENAHKFEKVKTCFVTTLIHPDKQVLFNHLWSIAIIIEKDDAEQLTQLLEHYWELFDGNDRT